MAIWQHGATTSVPSCTSRGREAHQYMYEHNETDEYYSKQSQAAKGKHSLPRSCIHYELKGDDFHKSQQYQTAWSSCMESGNMLLLNKG